MRINNLPETLKKKILPYYTNGKYQDIVAALELPAEPNVNFKALCDYLKLGDEAYRGTKWEMELFDVFPELEEFYNVSN